MFYYVKVDADGNIIKPVYVPPLQIPPDNYRKVNMESKIPKKLKWNETYLQTGVVREGDEYFMSYEIKEIAENNSELKKELFQKEFSRLKQMNEMYFQVGKISKEQFDQNTYILDNTNFDDESTYSLVEKMEFKMKAKIDSDGNVIQFPYVRPLTDEEENVVNVDTYKCKPKGLKWYQAARYDVVEKDENGYYVTYAIGEKNFSSDAEKEEVFKYFINDSRQKNSMMFSAKKITQEQYDSNLQILDSIVTNDPNYYDDIYKLKFEVE